MGPVWFAINLSDLSYSELILWPLRGPTQLDNPDEIIRLVQSFMSDTSGTLSVATQQQPGWIHVQQDPSGQYRGVWIPQTTPNLERLVKQVFELWRGAHPEFESWVRQFFGVRLVFQYLRVFQLSSKIILDLPPLFILNPQQLKSLGDDLISQDRPSFPWEVGQEFLQSRCGENVYQAIVSLPAEKKLTYVYLLQHWLSSRPCIDRSGYFELKAQLEPVAHELAEVIIFNYLQNKISGGDIPPADLISLLRDHLENLDGMEQILLLRVLLAYYKQVEDVVAEELLLERMLIIAPKQSWSYQMDLVYTQLNLARTAVLRGDYFRAMTFYSFALQGFTLLADPDLNREMELEFQRIAILAASQQLQAGLHQINHGARSRASLLTLIDGIQNGLGYYLRYSVPMTLDQILPPLLHSAALSMKIYSELFADLFPSEVNVIRLSQTTKQLSSGDREQLREHLLMHIDELSFKDQKYIERVTVFYEDGRHIGDYTFSNGHFVRSLEDPTQSLFSSAMSAVGMIITEATQSESSVDEISVGNKIVLYEAGSHLTFCLIAKSSNPTVKNMLKKVALDAELRFEPFLSNWTGNLSLFDSLDEVLSPLGFFAVDTTQ